MPTTKQTESTPEERIAELEAALFDAHQEIVSLQAQLAESEWIAEALRERTRQWGERTKELECLYRISDSLRAADCDVDRLLQQIVEAIPTGYQHPEATSAELTVRDRRYRSPGFRTATTLNENEIRSRAVHVGNLRVFVSQAATITGQPAILPEERVLLRTIATWLGEILDRKLG